MSLNSRSHSRVLRSNHCWSLGRTHQDARRSNVTEEAGRQGESQILQELIFHQDIERVLLVIDTDLI